MCAARRKPHVDDAEATVDSLVELVRQLSLAERRLFMRRLRVAGLIPPETLLTDREPARIAPAIGDAIGQLRAAKLPPSLRSSTSSAVASDAVASATTASNARAPARIAQQRDSTPESYKSPVSGRVVIGTPSGKRTVLDPHAMSPLPGQAPEQPIGVVFDGGSKGEPGDGYGSCALYWPGAPEQLVRLTFGQRVTSVEAQYDALIAALDMILERLADGGIDPAYARLDVRGHSPPVVGQVLGEQPCANERQWVRREHAREKLARFGRWQLRYLDRAQSEAALEY